MALLTINSSEPNPIACLVLPEIKCFRKEKDYIVYVISVTVEGYSWTVERRYSEFLRFDQQRFKHLKQSFLPSKNTLKRQDDEFLEKRRSELEKYIRTVFELEILLQRKSPIIRLPRLLAMFLDFHKYEVHAICDELAVFLSEQGERILVSGEYYETSPVHLYAISARLNLAEPTCSFGTPECDFGHVLEFAHRLEHLKIRGSKVRLGTTDIIPNNLEFKLNAFKTVSSLWITDCDSLMILNLDTCRLTVVNLIIHRSASNISDIALEQDIVPDESLSLQSYPNLLWQKLKMVDMSFNNISHIDKSVIFFRCVEILNLTGNRLTTIDYLQHLTNLTELDLSHNKLETISDWHYKLGNLKRLTLTANKLKSVEGLRKLYSLEHLDLRCNLLVQTVDVRPIGGLPCLKSLMLNGNPLDASVEYRSRILEWFGDRASEILLDGEEPNQRELDTVGVRLAIRKSKEDHENQKRLARERVHRDLNLVVDPSYPHSSSNHSFDDDEIESEDGRGQR